MATPVIGAGVVDALGQEAHGVEFDNWDINEIEANLNRVAALGLPIYITEFDIDERDDAQQLEVMQQLFPLFYTHPEVQGITLWGYVVGGTWVSDSGLIHPDGTHRPAMDWLMNYLER